MAAAVYPGWSGAGGDTARDWDTIYIGGVILPGECSIKGLKVGIDCDTKKAKGSDQATSTDNGLASAKFGIIVRITDAQWPEFQSTIENWNPRRPGRDRQPLEIIHPLPNAFGIRNIRVISVEPEHPTAKGGMRIILSVEEWFDKPKAVTKKTEKPAAAATGISDVQAARLLRATQNSLIYNRHRDLESIEESDPSVFTTPGRLNGLVITKNMLSG